MFQMLIHIPFFTGTGLAFSLMTLDSEMAIMRNTFNTVNSLLEHYLKL